MHGALVMLCTYRDALDSSADSDGDFLFFYNVSYGFDIGDGFTVS